MSIYFPIILGAVSFMATMPLGPVNMEVIRRTLDRRTVTALFFAMGAASADGLWPLVTFFGLTPLLEIRWVAAVFWGTAASVLAFLGISYIRDARTPLPNSLGRSQNRKEGLSFAAGFVLVSTNPTNLVTWVTVIGTLHKIGLLPDPSFGSGLILWLAVTVGTLAYFCLIIFLVRRNHHLFISSVRLRLIKTLFGWVILGVAVCFGYSMFRTIFSA